MDITSIKMGIDSYFNSGNYCFIEWPSLVESILMDSYTSVRIEKKNEKRELFLL